MNKRFWDKVNKSDPSGCWMWDGAVSRNGYGNFWLSKDEPNVLVHRYAWIELYGPIPEGHRVRAKCGNRLCVHPHHLEVTTKLFRPTASPRPLRRFFNLVNITDTCWLWIGSVNNQGYGVFHVGEKAVLAHRWIYDQVKEDLEPGMEIDHGCGIRRCVNYEHLSQVTHAENVRRAFARAKAKDYATK